MTKHLIQTIKFVIYTIVALIATFSLAHEGIFATLVALLFDYFLFFYVIFRKEMDPPKLLKRDKQVLKPLSESKEKVYQESGLTDQEVAFFRSRMAIAKEQILRLEDLFARSGKLAAIDHRYLIVDTAKDYFKELANQPLRLGKANDFLYKYLPGMVELLEKYHEISNHVVKTSATYESLEETAKSVEEIGLGLIQSYQEFQAQDLQDLEDSMAHLTKKEDILEFEDF